MTTTQNLTTTNRFHASAPATCACSPRLKNTTIMMPMADTPDDIYHDNEDDHDDAKAEGDDRALTFNRYHRFRHVPADCMPRLSFRYVPYHPTSSPFAAIKCCAE